MKINVRHKIVNHPFLYALIISLQLLTMMIVLSGLFYGLRDGDFKLETQALIYGAFLFYGAHWVKMKWLK